MTATLAELLVSIALAKHRLVIALSVAVAVLSAIFLGANFTVRTDLDALISRDLPWRKTEAALEAAFVSQGDDLTLVVDGQTPEQADRIANLLMERLSERKDVFALAQRPDGGPFWEKEAFLFLTLPELRKATQELITAQPFLGPLAADPSLRGVMTAIDTSLNDQDPGRLKQLVPTLRQFDAQLADVEAGRHTMLSWQGLISGVVPSRADRRKLIALTPKLDYSLLQPAAAAEGAISKAMTELGLKEGEAEPNIKITGSVAMETDELKNLSDATGPIAMVSFAIMLAILFWGVRSMRVIVAIIMTVATGLMVTAAMGIFIFNRFTLVSVAFMPLFVGLGIDFAIQFSIRYRAEVEAASNIDAALLTTGRTVGPSVALAATVIGFGFLAFWPTSYKGVSELGLIAGIGMIVGAIFALTLLPAWLKVLKAGRAAPEEGLQKIVALYRAAEKRKWALLSIAGIAGLIGLFLLPSLKVDFDPVSLRSRKDQSVATFLDLTRDPDLTPNRLQVLAPNLAGADAIAARLRKLSAVSHVYTISDLVPTDQEAKLAIIADASLILDTTLSPFDVKSAPSDQEIVASLIKAATSLEVAGKTYAPTEQLVMSLASRLRRIAAGPESVRTAVALALTGSLPLALDQVRSALTAEPVTLDTLPIELHREWISADGRARAEITPSGDPADPDNLRRFVTAVRNVVSEVSGPPVMVVEVERTILTAFIEAGILSSIAICLMLFSILRRVRDVALTIAPVVLTFIFTLASLAAVGHPINPENLIALPLLLAIGVSFNIYAVIAWRDGATPRRRASLSHATLFSALTTGASFITLALSAHPGTASLGELLLVSLFWTVINALFLQPALLAFVRK